VQYTENSAQFSQLLHAEHLKIILVERLQIRYPFYCQTNNKKWLDWQYSWPKQACCHFKPVKLL